VQPALAIGEFFERALRTGLERKGCELARRLPELDAQPCILVEQRTVVENHVLARNTLQCRRLLIQEAARPPCLGGLEHLLAPLRFEPVERQDQLGERVNERQADEQEAEQDELEEGARVVHAEAETPLAGWL
jgi:hypothetical protein